MAQLVVKVTEKGINAVDKKLNSLTKSGTASEKMAARLAVGFMGVGTAAVTAGVAIAATTVTIAKNVVEMQNASRAAGLTAKGFNEAGFAASQYGLSVEQLGDAFKDTEEKVGEFLTTGGGGMQDFFDVMKINKEEANKFAESVKNLSGQQVLTKMVGQMEAAGKTTKEVSFALEGMASDLTRMIPLLSNSGAEMTRLSVAMSNVTNPLDEEDVQTYRDLNEAVGLAEGAFASLAANALAPVAEYTTALAEDWAHLLATFNSGTVAQKSSRLAEITDEIEALEKRLSGSSSFTEKLKNSFSADWVPDSEIPERLASIRLEYAKLQKELGQMTVGVKADPSLFVGPLKPEDTKSSTKTAAVIASEETAAAAQLQIAQDLADAEAEIQAASTQAVIDSLKTEEQLRLELYNKQKEILNQSVLDEATKNQAMLDLQSQYNDDVLSSAYDLEQDKKRVAKEAERLDEMASSQKISALNSTTKALKDTLGEQSVLYKAAAITNTTIATYESATLAYKSLVGIPYVGPVLAPAAAGVAIAAGMANVASISSARAQGGQVTAGTTYEVGERGRETFTPNQSGTITPNSQLGGGGGVTNNVYNYTDSSVSTEENESGGVDVYVKKSELPAMLGAEMGSPNSKANQSIKSVYKMQRA